MSLLKKIKKLLFGYDIFISYSRKDSLDYAYAIAQYFMKLKYECYIDQLSSTTPGDVLPNNIKAAIKRSASFVLIGSEGTHLSEPIENELQIFTTENKNKPLIPITISGAINNKARWYKSISGLSLIEDSKENLESGNPAQEVLDRIQNALNFTKKSITLRNTSITVLFLILSISGIAFFYSNYKARQAAFSNKNSEMQKIIFRSRVERDNSNSTLAFQYAREALRMGIDIGDTLSPTLLLADFLNNLPPKFLNDTLMPFWYKGYGSDRQHFIANMNIYAMNSDNTQVLEYSATPTVEQKLNYEVNTSDKWIRKFFKIGLIDIKGDSVVPSREDKNLSKYYEFNGYYFWNSLKDNRFYIITDTNSQNDSAGQLVLAVLDSHLTVLKRIILNSFVSNYLLQLNESSKSGEYNLINSISISNGFPIITLLHLSKEFSISIIKTDSEISTPTYFLTKLKLDRGSDSKSVIENSVKSLTVTADYIFYTTEKQLVELNLHSRKEQIIYNFKINKVDKLNFKFVVNKKSDLIFILDSANLITILKKSNDRWDIISKYHPLYEQIENLSFDENNNVLKIACKNEIFSFDLPDYITKTKNQYYSLRSETFDSTGNNFHFENKDELMLVDNNDVTIRRKINTADPKMIKYSDNNKMILCLDNNLGQVSVTDLSNIFLSPTHIDDDEGYNPSNFKQLPPFSLDSTISILKGIVQITASEKYLEVKVGDNVKIKYKPPATINNIGFLDNENLIYFFTTDNTFGSNTFNIYNLATGLRYEYNLKGLVKRLSSFQITKRFIYFSDSGNPYIKVIRIMNPEISMKDLNLILNKSIF